MPYPPMPARIDTRRLTLGPWRTDDLDAYRAMVHERDPRAKAAPRDGHPTADELRSTISRQQRSLDTTGLALLAVRRTDEEFLGYCGLTVGQASLEEPEIAYELRESAHGQGYATEAGLAIVDAATATGRSRLWATVRPWNTPSFRVLATLGFVASGRITHDEFGASHWMTRGLG